MTCENKAIKRQRVFILAQQHADNRGSLISEEQTQDDRRD